jgi:glutamate transport system substrate-binding protein
VLPEDRNRMQGRTFDTRRPVDLDLVVAAFSITPERINDEKVVFAGPYLTTQTTVLTRKDHGPVESLSGLDSPITVNGKARKQQVCTPGTSTSLGYLHHEVPAADIHPLQLNSECVALLNQGKIDAVVTDAAILAGFQAQEPTKLSLHNIASTNDEHWGIGLGQDFTGHDQKIQARRQLVLLALNDLLTSSQEGWEKAFEMLPATSQSPSDDVQVVADDRQPPVWGLQPVRRWPWEHAGSGSGR